MPDVPLGSQIFDLVFHPHHSTVYSALLSGQVKATTYDQHGQYTSAFSLKLSERSIRGITIDQDGSRAYAVGKGKAIYTIDTANGKLVESRRKAHEAPINRVKHLTPRLLATGDDEGVIKLWDPRQAECVRSYNHHFDYITDFLWLEDSKHLVATSGDGTLSVMDVRSKKLTPLAQSEDQEDELLSLVSIKRSTKVVVGTQIGVLTVFNRKSGWGDCVDRLPGHPSSVDALCALPESLPHVDSSSTILSGSSDGFVRAVQVFPTKLLGVVADHEDWPVERIAVGEGMGPALQLDDDVKASQSGVGGDNSENFKAEGDESVLNRWWIGSVGHEEILKLTDISTFFEADDEADEDEDARTDMEDPDIDSDAEETSETGVIEESKEEDAVEEAVEDSEKEEEDDNPRQKKRQKKDTSLPKKKGRHSVEVEAQFFDEL